VLKALEVESVDLYGFSSGAGCAAAYLSTASSGPTFNGVVLVNPYLPEVVNDEFKAAGGGKLFGWSKGADFLELVDKWLNVKAKIPGFLVQAIEHERSEWPENYWLGLGEQISQSTPVLGQGKCRLQPAPKVLLVLGEKDKVNDATKSEAVFSKAMPDDMKLFKIANCGHAGVDDSATKNIFGESAAAASQLLFGSASKL